MEEYEVSILTIIQNNDETSQREISKKLGISLGNVNLLIKRFTKVGIIQMERLDGNKVKYMLTPSGFIYLSKKTVSYISRSYQAVLKIQEQVASIAAIHFLPSEKIILVGPKDEVAEISISVLKRMGHTVEIHKIPPQDNRYMQWSDPNGKGIYILK